MTSTFMKRVHARSQRLNHALRGHYWFPHVPLSLLLGLAGYWLLRASFGSHGRTICRCWRRASCDWS